MVEENNISHIDLNLAFAEFRSDNIGIEKFEDNLALYRKALELV